jgi:hypothetical protein
MASNNLSLEDRRSYGRTIGVLAYLIKMGAITGYTNEKGHEFGPCQAAALIMRRAHGCDTRTVAVRIKKSVQDLEKPREEAEETQEVF